MTTHSGGLACRIAWTEEPRELTVQRVAESWTGLKGLRMRWLPWCPQDMPATPCPGPEGLECLLCCWARFGALLLVTAGTMAVPSSLPVQGVGFDA